MDDRQTARGACQRHIQRAQPAGGRLPLAPVAGGDEGGFGHHHPVELEAVRLVGGQEHERRGEALAPRVARVHRVEAPLASAAPRAGSKGAGASTATRPGVSAASSSAAASATRSASVPGAAATKRGRSPDSRTGRGGVMSGAATRSTRAAISTTSAGVR